MMNSQPTSFSTCPMPGVKNSNTIEPSSVSLLMALSRSDRLATSILPPSTDHAGRHRLADLRSVRTQKCQSVRCGKSDQAKDEPNHSQPHCTPEEIDHPRDEIGGGEHDGDLECSGAKLEVMVLGHGVVALGLRRERSTHQFLTALALVVGFGLTLIACSSLPPFFHPVREQVLHCCVLRELNVDFHLLGRGLHGDLADGLGLIELPQIGRLDIETQRFRLGALAKRLGDRKE